MASLQPGDLGHELLCLPVPLRIGTAGWSIPKPHVAAFGADGTHLQRYATRLNAVEINSSFYRAHKPATYARWAASVPDKFRFAVKLPRSITHEKRLRDCDDLLGRFMEEVAGLNGKLGPILVQLPPSLHFDAASAGRFFQVMRAMHDGLIACEPRHQSWFDPVADDLLAIFQIARVAADPAVVPQAGIPGAWPGLVYLRLHGSPRMYYSAYSPAFLDRTAQTLRDNLARSAESWCIFDNTALGEATLDALALQERLAVA